MPITRPGTGACRSAETSASRSGRTRGVHRQLIATLTGNRDRTLKSLGYMLEQCRALRVEADYEIETDFPPEDARTALEQCEKILNKAGAFLQAPTG